MGQLITYAAGQNAELCIWIVARAREEYEQAIKWLNENTISNINFFLIEMEAWQIESSPPAAKFNIVVKPNDWAKIIRQGDRNTQLYALELQDFWEKVREYGEENSNHINSWLRAKPRGYYDISLGSPRAKLVARAKHRSPFVAMELYIPNDQDLFDQLKEKRVEIEKQLNYEVSWLEKPNRRYRAINMKKSGDFRDEKQQDQLVKWLVEKAEELAQVFKKHL